MRVHLITGLGCAVMIASSLAEAHQFDLGIGQSIRMESNIFGSPTNPIADGTYRISPDFALGGRFEKLRGGSYQLSYRPNYRWYFRSEGVNGLDNRANGTVQVDVTRRDRLSASGSYAEFQAVEAISQANGNGSFDVLASDAGETIRAFGALDYSRSLSRRDHLRLSLDFQDFAYRNSRNVGNKSVGAVASYTRAYSSRLTLGGTISVRHRVFDEQLFVGGSKVLVTNFSALGSFQLTPEVSFDFQGGPTLIRTQPGTVAGRPTPQVNKDFTYFMDIALRRKFQSSNFEVSYVRNEDPSGGSSRTSVLDTVSAVMNSRLSEKWRGSAIMGWSRRKTVDAFLILNPITLEPLPFSQETQLDRVWTSLSVERVLDERVRVRFGFRYQRWIDYKVGGVDRPRQENFSGSITLNYAFAPYIF